MAEARRAQEQMERKTGRPTREAAALLPAAILDGARRAFCEKGVASTSMADIASAAGATRLTLYRRFESKETLLSAVVERDLNRRREELDRATTSSPDPLAALHETVWSIYRLITSLQKLDFTNVLRAEAAFNPSLSAHLLEWDAILCAFLGGRIVVAQPADVLSPADPAWLARLLFDMMESITRRLRREGSMSGKQGGEAEMATRWSAFLAVARSSQTRFQPGRSCPTAVPQLS